MSSTPVTHKADDRGFDAFGLMARFAPLIFLVILMAVFATLQPRFLSTINLFNVLRQISISGLLAIGMTFVILTAGIDLSVGSLLAFCGIAAAIVAKGSAGRQFWGARQRHGNTRLVAGFAGRSGDRDRERAHTRHRKSPRPRFRLSWSRWAECRSSAARHSCCRVAGRSAASTRDFNSGVRVVSGSFPHRSSSFWPSPSWPTSSFATRGSDAKFMRSVETAEAARLSGLKVPRILLSVYVLMGFFSGLAGFVLAARLNSAEAVAGLGYELTVIASVVIGGTSLFGGIGTIFGTVIGAVLIGVLLNGLVLLNVSSYIQQIVIGLIIVLAVAFDTYAKSRQKASLGRLQ